MDQDPLIPLGPSPRQGAFAEAPGSYQPVIRIRVPILDPGDTVEGDLFITGYGMIQTAKLVFYPSTGVFEAGPGEFRFGIQDQDGLITFGGDTHKGVGADGLTIFLTSGMEVAEWDRPTPFFDVEKGTLPRVATETRLTNSPVEFRLPTQRNARPGQYTLTFVLTYYNGAEWRSSVQSVSFTIRNLLQRHEIAIAILAAIGVSLAMITDIAEIVDLVRGLF
jgi:hypothetical protein